LSYNLDFNDAEIENMNAEIAKLQREIDQANALVEEQRDIIKMAKSKAMQEIAELTKIFKEDDKYDFVVIKLRQKDFSVEDWAIINNCKSLVEEEKANLARKEESLARKEESLARKEELLLLLHNRLARNEELLLLLHNRRINLNQSQKSTEVYPSSIESESIVPLLNRFPKLKISKNCASAFTASKCNISENCGFTAYFPVPFMRPKIVIDVLQISISSADIDISSVTVKAAMTVAILPYKLHETKSGNCECFVESIAGNQIQSYLEFQTKAGIKYKRQMYLSELIAVDGIATDNSHSDGIVYSEIGNNLVGTGVVELKDTAYAPLEQLGQSFATASNLCLGQLKHGLQFDKCCVAIMASNGQLYQFGFVTLLYPSFPVSHITSDVLDSKNADGLKEIAMHLCRFRETCRSQDTDLRRSIVAYGDVYCSLDMISHFIKPVKQIFLRFATHRESILKLYEIYQRLYENHFEEAVLPVAILTGKFDDKNYMINDSIIYPMLSNEFKMGVPFDDDDFRAYIVALINAYQRMHKSGIVHLDGYPSNILWKKGDNDQIVIRFVDFDVASFINENFDENISKNLKNAEFILSGYYWNECVIASSKHDAWFVFMFGKMSKEERKASSEAANNKHVGEVIAQYWELLHRVVKTESLEKIVQEFNEWFEKTWQASNVLV
jgi:hypothetical protein